MFDSRVIAIGAAVTAILGVTAAMSWLIQRDGWLSREEGAPERVRPPTPPWGRLLALGAVVFVPTAMMARLTSTSGFVWDDIKNLRQAQVESVSIHHLLEPTSGHFAPGHRLADWMLERSFGFSFTAAQVVLLIGFAVMLVVFHRLLAELFQPGAGPLLLTLVFAVSITHVGVVQWWASGMDRLPATILSFLCILFYLHFHRTGSRPFLAASVAALALAELFYVKPVFVPLYLILMWVLVLEPDRPLPETLRATARAWRVWLLYAVTATAFAIVYLRVYPTDLNATVSPRVLSSYVGTLWVRVVVPNLLGLWVPKDAVSAPMWIAAAAAQVLLVALIVWTVARWRPAWRAWTFFAVGLLANTLIVGVTRIGFFTAKQIAYTVYYNLEATFLFVVALGAAFLRVRGARTGPPPLIKSPGTRAVVGVSIAAYVALSWWGGYQISEPDVWIGARSKLYLDVTTEQLRALRGTDFALVDGVVPDDVMPYTLVPYNSASEVFPLIDDRIGFDPTGRALFHAGPDGTVRPVTFVPDAGGDVASLLQRGLIGVLGATPVLVGTSLCMTAGAEPATVGIVPPAPVSGDDLALRLEFAAKDASVMSLVVDPRPVITSGPAKGHTKFRVVKVEPGEGQTRVFALDAPTVSSLFILIDRHSELCVRSIELGRVVAA